MTMSCALEFPLMLETSSQDCLSMQYVAGIGAWSGEASLPGVHALWHLESDANHLHLVSSVHILPVAGTHPIELYVLMLRGQS